MSADSRPYVIRAGDYLEKLAHTLGFDVESVWEAADNAELREKRADHNVLCPGDVLMVPGQSCAAPPTVQGGTSNDYAAEVPCVEVKVILLGLDDQPLKSEACQVEGLVDAPTQTDGDGALVLRVPVTQRFVDVLLPEKSFTLRLDVGGLDPHEETSGIKQRLANLGLYPNLGEDEDEALLPNAIRVFQRNAGIEETGSVCEATKKALLDTHRI